MSEQHPNRITVLPGFEAIRRHPLRYVPNLSSQGLHWLAGKLVRAAIEPTYQNQCSQLRLVISSDGSLIQSDNGRGLPIEQSAHADSRSVLDIAVTALFAGHNPPPSFYARYRFLAYFGPILNSLSESLSITTHHDGQTYHTSYARGYVTEPLHVVKSLPAAGSVIRVRPDAMMWDKPCFARDAFYEVVRLLAVNCPTITMTLYDEQSDTEIRLP